MINLRTIKEATKAMLYRLIPKDGGYSNLRVLTGPAKRTLLRLDLRVEGSYWLGTYDKWIFDQIPFSKLIQPGSVVWDCGSYVGYYTACFRNFVGPTGQVHAFEASTPNYQRLRGLPARNNWTNVFVHNVAVGPEHSILEFVENLGGASGPYGLSKSYDPKAQLTINKVPCRGIDELVYEQGIPAPAFMKLDLESAEEFALHNGDRVFSTQRPLVLLEIHGASAKAATGLFLERYSYAGIQPTDYAASRRFIRSREDCETLDGDWQMLLCVPQ